MNSDQFFNRYTSPAPKVFPVTMPDGEGGVFVRILSARAKTAYEAEFGDKKKKGQQTARERLVVLCACDEAGKPLFDASHVGKIGDMDCDIIDPVFDRAFAVNGFEAKLLEQIRKNSESDQIES